MRAIAMRMPIQDIVHIQINNGSDNVRRTFRIMVRSWGGFPPEKRQDVLLYYLLTLALHCTCFGISSENSGSIHSRPLRANIILPTLGRFSRASRRTASLTPTLYFPSGGGVENLLEGKTRSFHVASRRGWMHRLINDVRILPAVFLHYAVREYKSEPLKWKANISEFLSWRKLF